MQVDGTSFNNTLKTVAAYEGEDSSPFASVPREILRLIFSYLSTDLGRAAQVCHSWKDNAKAVIQLKDEEALKKYGALGRVFLAAEWKKYFGEDVKDSPIPRGIFAWLDRPSVKMEGSDGKNGETGFLFLMPKGLSLNSMRKLTRQATGLKYLSYPWEVKNQHGSTTVGKSHLVWISRNWLLGSREKTYIQEQTIVKDLGNSYELPKALEVVVLSIAWYMSHNKERLLTDNRPGIYTACQEVIVGGWPVNVGGFAPGGLCVNYADYDHHSYGAAVCRKFPAIGH